MKYKFHYEEIYRWSYFFILNVPNTKKMFQVLKKNSPKTLKYIQKELPNHVDIDNCGGRCIFLPEQTKTVIVINSSSIEHMPFWYATLAHEALHATIFTLNTRGVEFIPGENNEAFTYHMDSLIRIALEK